MERPPESDEPQPPVELSPKDLAREVIFARLLAQPVRLTWWMVGVLVVLWLGLWGLGAAHLAAFFKGQATQVNGLDLATYTGMKATPQILHKGQWWRLISSMFIHLDVTHLAFNAYGLYQIGPLIERFFGKSRWVIVYVLSGVVGSLASLYWSDVPSAGASGAIYGVVGALLVFGYKYRAILPERVSHAFTRGLAPWVVFGIGIGIVGVLPMDNAAHLGGLATGALLALVMPSRLHAAPTGARRHAVRALAVMLSVGTCVALALWAREIATCAPTLATYAQCYPELFTATRP